MPWRTKDVASVLQDWVELQFGHGFDAVEDARNRRPRRPGPCSFNSGQALMPWRTVQGAEAVAKAVSLQFGHGFDAVEDLARQRVGHRGYDGLQFGHGFDAVEDTRFRSAAAAGPRLRFNSATALMPWRTAT